MRGGINMKLRNNATTRWIFVIVISILGIGMLISYYSFDYSKKEKIKILQDNLSKMQNKENVPLEILSKGEMKKDTPVGQWLYKDQMLIEDKDGIYVYDSISKKRTKIDESKNVSGHLFFISRDGKQIFIPLLTPNEQETSYYIYNVITGEKKYGSNLPFLFHGGFDETGRYITVGNGTCNENELVIIDTEDGKTNSIDLKKFDLKLNLKPGNNTNITNVFSEDGKDIYFIINVWGNGDYIDVLFKYSVKNPQSVEQVMQFPNNGDYMRRYDIINKGESIIFRGKCNGQEGIFVYSIKKKTITRVIPNAQEKENNFKDYDYIISKDKSKIVYGVRRGEESGVGKYDIYAAKLVGEKISNSICVLENMPSVFNPVRGRDSGWNIDGKKVIVSLSEVDNKTPGSMFRSYISFIYYNYMITIK